MVTIGFLAFISLAIIIWIMAYPWRIALHRRQVMSNPFPKPWRHILKAQVPYFFLLPTDLQLRLKKLIFLFVHDKQFIGCNDLEINDEIRVTIAAQACLLLLNKEKETDYYGKLDTILVYPEAFIVDNEQVDDFGVAHRHSHVLSGESWEQGKVILSWANVLKDAAAPGQAGNVVFHEFAHQLDQLSGKANGAPRLGSSKKYRQWSEVMKREFAQLNHAVESQQPSLIDAYGATNPAEFFAVCTEVFFEQAHQLKAQHPQLFQCLRRYYRLDPSEWLPQPKPVSH
ncbi:zinc-dependent peptidase [Shewanella sp. NIFS-20-20]|uniref:M90 family metallopeptidase n=1 Tax=Shewanella sp. NIFS-20-20 TaxID=2853806 RepID=UPI001C492F5A|nr:M90 family metallopeptidase [Shewanella sp. NIFS-20-20]MBV7317131.1 zinc-dependent peptidase [Shewanella sp. NIFS-20-20]